MATTLGGDLVARHISGIERVELLCSVGVAKKRLDDANFVEELCLPVHPLRDEIGRHDQTVKVVGI